MAWSGAAMNGNLVLELGISSDDGRYGVFSGMTEQPDF